MEDIDIELKGEDEIRREIDKARKKVPGAVGAALYERAVGVMSDSKKATPVDTGRLRSSGFVTAPIEELGGLKVIMGYGTEYAVFVHEDTDASHEVGGAKFLQRPLEDKQSDMVEQIAKSVKVMVERGITLESFSTEGNEFPQKPNPTEKKAERERKRAFSDDD